MEIKFRTLTAAEIDCRVSQTLTGRDGTPRVGLLLYKDARVDQKLLDEQFGPMGWQRAHQVIGDRLYCIVSVWDKEKSCWVSKQDVGVESNTEKEKGQASDAFKRACFNWGIGRELYTAPTIWISLNEKEYTKQGDKVRVWAKFSVSAISYDADRNITGLEIKDNFGRVRYLLKDGKEVNLQGQRPAAPQPQKPAYKPMDEKTYWRIVQNYAFGILAKSKRTYREEWISYTNAGPAEIASFDHDVENVRLANNL